MGRRGGIVMGQVKSADAGADNTHGGATYATDVLVRGRGEVGEKCGVVDDHAIGSSVEDKGAAVGVTDEAVGQGG